MEVEEPPSAPSTTTRPGIGGGEEDAATSPSFDMEEDEAPLPSSRQVCRDGCGRPQRACLCPYLPQAPVPTSTSVVVLQHPHEIRRRLSSSPLLPRCLLNCHLVPGRRLQPGSLPILDSLHRVHSSAGAGEASTPAPALFLFPSTVGAAAAHDEEELSGYRGRCRVLIVFDGTWKHAGEMVRASLPFLSGFARRVSLAGGRDRGVDGDSMFESELALRKEPSRGCLSTMEAVARALRLLEGPDVERVLLSVLRAMVGLQRAHLAGKTVRPRRRLLKKGAQKKGALAEAPEEGG